MNKLIKCLPMMTVIFLSFNFFVKKLAYVLLLGFLVTISTSYAGDKIDLLKAVDLTLLNNNELLVKSFRLDADKQAVNKAWADVKPFVSASFLVGDSQYSTDFNRGSLKISQVLYSRKHFLNIDRTNLSVEAKKYLFKYESQLKVLQVITAYIDLLEFKKIAQITKKELEDDSVNVARLKNMLDLGLSTKMDVLEAQSRADSLQANLIRDNNNKLIAKQQLERRLGVSITGVEPVDLAMWQRSADFIAYKQWDSMAFANSLLLKTMASKISATKLDVKMARAEYLPELNLHLDFTRTATGGNARLNDNKIYVELTMPLYSGGRTSSNLSAMRSLLLSDQYSFKKEKQNLKISLSEALSNLEATQANIVAYKKSRASSLAFVKAAKKGLEHGINSVADVLRAKGQMHHSERLLYQAIYQNLSYQFELLFLIGAFSPSQIEGYLADSFSVDSLLN